MTLMELLGELDGYGLIVTDEELITERLNDLGIDPQKEMEDPEIAA